MGWRGSILTATQITSQLRQSPRVSLPTPGSSVLRFEAKGRPDMGITYSRPIEQPKQEDPQVSEEQPAAKEAEQND